MQRALILGLAYVTVLVTVAACGQAVCVGPLGQCDTFNRKTGALTGSGVRSPILLQAAQNNTITIAGGGSFPLQATGGTAPYNFTVVQCAGPGLPLTTTNVGTIDKTAMTYTANFSFTKQQRTGMPVATCMMSITDSGNNLPQSITIYVNQPPI